MNKAADALSALMDKQIFFGEENRQVAAAISERRVKKKVEADVAEYEKKEAKKRQRLREEMKKEMEARENMHNELDAVSKEDYIKRSIAKHIKNEKEYLRLVDEEIQNELAEKLRDGCN
jgi:hypothetical protein